MPTTNDLASFLRNYEPLPLDRPIAVIGDILLDEFVLGEVQRLSPEAPCPVFLERDRYTCPGGAANVARQLSPWCPPILIGWATPLAQRVIYPHNAFSFAPKTTNPVKTRFMVDGKQIFRHDLEEISEFIPCKHVESILQATKPAAVILSDYNKGALSHELVATVAEFCGTRIPLIADPKFRHGIDWSVVPLLKTTTSEIPVAYPNPTVVYTRGAGGPICNIKGDVTQFEVPWKLPPCVNVVGAGDCFAAVLAVGLANGMDVKMAAVLAHLAGNVYVSHPRMQPVFPDEMMSVLEPYKSKIIHQELKEAISIIHRRHGSRIILSNGVFDLPHPGHFHTLEWARKQGDALVVAVNSDASTASIKGKMPMMDLRTRCTILSHLPYVDWIIPFDRDSPEALVKMLLPYLLVKGPEYAGSEANVPGTNWTKVVCAPTNPFALHTSDYRAKA